MAKDTASHRPPSRRANWKRHLGVTLAVALTLMASTARPDYPLEIIDLRARLPEELIPTLQPLAGPDGVVTGSGHSLFLRVSPQHLADIRRALARLDTPGRNLLIQVRRSATAGAAGGTRSASRNSEIAQEVRTLDGRPAFIAAGTERPESWREGYRGPEGAYARRGISYRRAETGFYVTPRVNGDRVTLDVGAFSAQPAGGRRLDTGDLQTSVSTRLGDWVPIGGSQSQESRSGSGPTYWDDVELEGQTDIELRVIEVP